MVVKLSAKEIHKILNSDRSPGDLAYEYGVSVSTIYRILSEPAPDPESASKELNWNAYQELSKECRSDEELTHLLGLIQELCDLEHTELLERARTRLKTFRRRTRRAVKECQVEAFDTPELVESDPMEDLRSADLSEDQKLLIELRLQGFTFREIAEVLNVSHTQVSRLFKRVRKKIVPK